MIFTDLAPRVSDGDSEFSCRLALFRPDSNPAGVARAPDAECRRTREDFDRAQVELRIRSFRGTPLALRSRVHFSALSAAKAPLTARASKTIAPCTAQTTCSARHVNASRIGSEHSSNTWASPRLSSVRAEIAIIAV